MAKLPKVKSKTEEVEEELGTTNEPETSEDQTDAVTGIIDRATETVAGSEEGAETEESEETDSGEEPSEESNEESPKQEGDETSGDDNFGVTITAPKPTVSTKATTVKVATVCDHSCHIGGKPYHFKKGVPTSVPEPVKQILKNAGLLAAL